MANRDMKVSVLVQLIDRLTAPLRGITRGIAATANRIGDLGRRIGLIGGALAALSFMAPMQQAAAWDGQLRDIAITAGKTGGAVEAMIKASSVRYEKLATEVGQRSEVLAKGAQLLIAAGMNDGLIDKLLPTIGRVATAAGAAVEDTAKTAFALNETLKIKPEEMELALAKLVTAGKLGRFEFKNMASEFPGLTAQMAKLGVTGMEAVNFLGASLQTAMLGTDSPSEAANNLKNFLTKINAPEAIKKFEKELKVDVTGVMTDAAAKGINPVEAVVQKLTDKLKVPKAEIDKIMKKAGQSGMSDKEREATIRKQVEQLIQGSQIGKVFADMQVLDFLIPMLLNTAKFKEMKQQIAASGIDVIANDFASRMRGLSGQMMLFGEVGTQVMRRIGLAFASNLPTANRALTSLLQWVSAVDAKWPGLIDGVLTWSGALLALGAGIAVLTPVISALVGTLGLLLSPLLLLATPIGAAVAGFAALAAAATYLWMNWSTVGPQLTALWDGLAATVTAKLAEVVTSFQQFPGYIVATFAPLAGMLQQAGAAAIQGLWDGMVAKFDALLAWFRGKMEELKSLLSIGGPSISNPAAKPGTNGPATPSAPSTMDGFNPTSAPGGGIGGSNGFTRTTAANSNVQVGGQITIAAAEGTRVVNVQSQNPAVPMVPNRGTMLGRA